MSKIDWDAKRSEVLAAPKNGYDMISEADKGEMAEYCSAYIDFLDAAKTEREAVIEAVSQAEKAGFTAYDSNKKLVAGDKIYYINRGKNVTFAVIGEKPLALGARFCVSHIDAPRLDLKPNPLYEDGEMAYLKTHYYGGIKKYQWTAIPLALHGILALTDGSILHVNIGEDDKDPVFCITDLLIHLSKDQMKKTLADGVSGENLNILFGSQPVGEEKGSDRVKLGVMMLLNEKYGIIEEDFLSAELILVPAVKAREVGLDRSFIGAYGHDDRVCAYAGLYPLLAMTEIPAHSAFCVMVDKEEIGSEGVTSMQSAAFDTFIEKLCMNQGGNLRDCFAYSICMSSDVANGYDPIYGDVSDRRNSAKINYGIAVCKYTGSRGKSGASDASGELMARFRRCFSRGDVIWQISELGKVDAGGGGTIAKFMAMRNIDTLDAGVPVLSMHAPFEIVSKLDTYMTMKASRAFYNMD